MHGLDVRFVLHLWPKFCSVLAVLHCVVGCAAWYVVTVAVLAVPARLQIQDQLVVYLYAKQPFVSALSFKNNDTFYLQFSA